MPQRPWSSAQAAPWLYEARFLYLYDQKCNSNIQMYVQAEAAPWLYERAIVDEEELRVFDRSSTGIIRCDTYT